MNPLFDSTSALSSLVGRVLIAVLFVISGWGKMNGYAGTQAFMQASGVPGSLLPLVILLELGGGIAIVLGLFTRPVALLMAGLSIVTGLIFHSGSADQTQQIMLMKNLGLAGGFLFLVAHGAGRISLDQLMQNRRKAL